MSYTPYFLFLYLTVYRAFDMIFSLHNNNNNNTTTTDNNNNTQMCTHAFKNLVQETNCTSSLTYSTTHFCQHGNIATYAHLGTTFNDHIQLASPERTHLIHISGNYFYRHTACISVSRRISRRPRKYFIENSC